MSHEILFHRIQREALELPVQYAAQPVDAAPDNAPAVLPYVLGQAAEIREYAVRRRDALLGAGGVRHNVSTEADFVQSAIISLEDQLYSEMAPEEASELITELQDREQGFMNAGREQTGLEPPKSYRRIGSIAAGLARNVQIVQSRPVAI